jgi:hypothetical protein
MSDIPQARTRLEALRDEMIAAHLDYYVEDIDYILTLMVREKYKERTSRQSATMTPELADEIRNYAICHPNLSTQRIASHFNVNPGRVSEALAAVE